MLVLAGDSKIEINKLGHSAKLFLFFIEWL